MVDAVNNNRNTVYTAAGAAAGLLAGGGYGAWMSKPLLNGDAPSDTFVRRTYDNLSANAAKDAGEAAKKSILDAQAVKDADSIDTLKTLIKDRKDALGLKAEVDGDNKVTKDLDKVIEEYIGNETDVAKLKEKMGKTAYDVASAADTNSRKSGEALVNLKKAVGELKDDADEAARKAFIEKNADALGIKADDIAAESKKAVADIKAKANTVLAPLENAKAVVTEHFDVSKNSMKELASDATDATKGAFNAVKKAARDTKLWAGAKWAAGVGAALGLASYIGAKLTAPKAPAESIDTQA